MATSPLLEEPTVGEKPAMWRQMSLRSLYLPRIDSRSIGRKHFSARGRVAAIRGNSCGHNALRAQRVVLETEIGGDRIAKTHAIRSEFS
jgi:hypothetical protein